MAPAAVRFTTRELPDLLRRNDWAATDSGNLRSVASDSSNIPHSVATAANENVVFEALRVAALAHISSPQGFWGGKGRVKATRFELTRVPVRRGLRFLLSAPGGSGKLTIDPVSEAALEIGLSTQEAPPRDDSNIRRTLADRSKEHEKKLPGSKHLERHFVNKNGHRIYTQQWLPEEAPMKAAVVVLHGLNEHSGRYKHLARALTKKGYGVFGMDWYGHGRSDGLHGFVDRLDNTVQDAGAYLEMVKQQHPDVPCFLYGHSTGGAIALKAMRSAPRSEVAGLVLTAPAISITPPNPVVASVLPMLAEVAPTLQVESANRAHIKVSRDPASLADKYSDPLVYTGSIRVRTGHEVLRIASDVRRNLESVRHPFLVCHGTDDRVTLPEGSKELYKRAASKSKKIKLYKGCLHDLLLEPERDQLVTDVVAWMDQQLESTAEKARRVMVEKARERREESRSVVVKEPAQCL